MILQLQSLATKFTRGLGQDREGLGSLATPHHLVEKHYSPTQCPENLNPFQIEVNFALVTLCLQVQEFTDFIPSRDQYSYLPYCSLAMVSKHDNSLTSINVT